VAQAEASPQARAMRVMAPALFGPDHPYGLPSDGLGTADSLAALTPETVRAAHARWLRPDLARITVVGNVTMDQLKPLLEQAYALATVRDADPEKRIAALKALAASNWP